MQAKPKPAKAKPKHIAIKAKPSKARARMGPNKAKQNQASPTQRTRAQEGPTTKVSQARPHQPNKGHATLQGKPKTRHASKAKTSNTKPNQTKQGKTKPSQATQVTK